MKYTRCLWAVLSLQGLLVGQSFITSPPGYLAKAGASHSEGFTSIADGRIVIKEGELRGAARTFRSIAMRGRQLPHTIPGRSWTNLSLSIAHCDMSTLQTYFRGIPTTVPTSVFTGRFSLPTWSGPANPAVWNFVIPFSQSWVYSGASDFCTEWEFSGGRLAGGSLFGPPRGRHYPIEGSTDERQREYIDWVWSPNPPLSRGPVGCVDSAFSLSVGSTLFGLDFYRPEHVDPARQNTLRIDVASTSTAKGGPVVHMVSLGTTNLVTSQVGCENLFLDFSMPTWLFPKRAGNDSYATAVTLFVGPRIRFQPGYSGLHLYAQSVWTDSATGALKLTTAAELVLPLLQPGLPRRHSVYSYNPTALSGTLENAPHRQPIFRFGF